jgi:glycosyltransferase involved in cell wall biosynthesis
VIAVASGGPLYTDDGRRRIGPPLRFGLGVFLHLLRNRRRYDAVHSIAFPYFSLLAARAAAPRLELWVDWFEVWTRDYWREYLGVLGGRIGHAVQRLCVRLTRRAFVFSDLHARRLEEEGLRGQPIRLSGLYAGGSAASADPGRERPPLVVFAGRHIREKRAELVPAAVAAARVSLPELRARIFGDGPERPQVLAAIAAAGMDGVVDAPGFVDGDEISQTMAAATCHVLPSAREGYGLVVIEAAANGIPTVVVAGPDNAASELIEDGVNGYVAQTVDELPGAIVRVHEGGAELRRATLDWFERNAKSLSAAESARRIAAEYGRH